jgi:hypothetical protein
VLSQIHPLGQAHSPPQPSPPHQPPEQFGVQVPAAQAPATQNGVDAGQTCPHAPQLAGSELVSMQAPPQFVVPGRHPRHAPWLQTGTDAGQTTPHAPQLFESEFRSVHVPLQQAMPDGQQTYAPQLPHSRLVLPLQARQAARHWFRFALLGHDRQKAVHRSGLAAQAGLIPSVLSVAPAKTKPIVRSDSRRDTLSASVFDNSSKCSMIKAFLFKRIWANRQ